MCNIVLERIYQVKENLVRTNNSNKAYVDENNLLLVIFTEASFTVRSTANRVKYYSPRQLRFGCNINLLINKPWKIN